MLLGGTKGGAHIPRLCHVDATNAHKLDEMSQSLVVYWKQVDGFRTRWER